MLSFGRWWGRAQTPVLGVDIGAGGVHVVELARARPLRIAHYAHRTLPQGAIRDGAILLREAVCDALGDALRDSGSRLRHAALGLPAGAVIKKTLTLPLGLSEEELEMHVESEADASLPFARDEIGLDFEVVGTGASQSDGIEVMLVAARKEKIDERTLLAEAAGLKPLIVDVESHALISAVAMFEAGCAAPAPTPQLIAILQLDPDRSHCLFMQGGVLLYERELGSVLLKNEAAAIEAICQEFRRAFQLFQTATAFSELHKVYVTGAAPPDLPDAIAERMRVQVTLPDPLHHWSNGPAHESGMHSSACMLACGLALRSFDS
jgi:type IV pilus assembly protein PilM